MGGEREESKMRREKQRTEDFEAKDEVEGQPVIL